MFVYEMHPLKGNPLMKRHWKWLDHPDGGEQFLGSLTVYLSGQTDYVNKHYDVWLVDGLEVLLLQFGDDDGMNLTMTVTAALRLATMANNDRNQMWAYAYHMYLKRDAS